MNNININYIYFDNKSLLAIQGNMNAHKYVRLSSHQEQCGMHPECMSLTPNATRLDMSVKIQHNTFLRKHVSTFKHTP